MEIYKAITNKNITTVCDEVPSNRLGFCQCHEHIAIRRGRPYEVNPDLCIDDPELSIKELELYRKSGGNSIVDCQPAGCGRMADVLRDISERTGVNIVSSTGFHKMCYYPEDHWIHTCTSDMLADIFFDEIENGMYINCDRMVPVTKCNAKAGIIKAALENREISDNDKRLFKAAAIASVKTCKPIIVHIDKGSDPLGILDYLAGEKVDPACLIFCHMDRYGFDLEVHKKIAAQGVYLQYDAIGRPKYHSNEYEAEIIRTMADAGFCDRILLSLDTTRARLKSYGGTIGMDYLLTCFLPKLLLWGFTRAEIELITVGNPASALAAGLR